MPDTPQVTLFFIAAIALLVTPGPAVLYIIARSIEQGRMAGVVSTLGIALGSSGPRFGCSFWRSQEIATHPTFHSSPPKKTACRMAGGSCRAHI